MEAITFYHFMQQPPFQLFYYAQFNGEMFLIDYFQTDTQLLIDPTDQSNCILLSVWNRNDR